MKATLLIAALALAAAPADAAALFLHPGDCAGIVAYVADASVAYAPGRDVHGRPLVPADLEPGTAIDAEHIPIPIWVPIARTPGTPGDEGRFVAGGGAIAGFAADAVIGTVRVHGGRVFLDGRPLADNEAHALARACRDALDHEARKPRP